MPKSVRRKSMGVSQTTGKLQGNPDTMPPAMQRMAVAQMRRSLTKRNNAMLMDIMNDLNEVQRKLAASKSPFHDSIHRRLHKIKRRLSGKKAVMFAP